MEVFLIPAGADRYELYCEVNEDPAPYEDLRHGWRQRLADRFTVVVTKVEAARHGAAHRRVSRARRSVGRRIRDRVVCWLAEKIAEQRLLWHLRGQPRATAWFPDDLTEEAASSHVRGILRADADRHLRWMLVNAAGLVASLALVPIPGPNLILYYFIFRVVGHYLSRHGAHHGLDHVEWQMRSAAALTDLRTALGLDPDLRQRHVSAIASRLRLQHLTAFFERIAVAAP